MKQVKL